METATCIATVVLAFESRQTSSRQIGVQTWLALEPRFDSNEMKRARKKLAEQLDSYDSNSTKHNKITEEVLEFFESVGTVYNYKLLNKELADSSFSYYANRWWEAAKTYVDKERKDKGDDNSLFSEFEKLVKTMRKKCDPVIDDKDLKNFLADERRLKVD